MKVSRGWHVVMLLAWSAGSGCTALREIPRSDYVARAQNRPIRVVTREGRDYEFDGAKIEADTQRISEVRVEFQRAMAAYPHIDSDRMRGPSDWDRECQESRRLNR